MTPEQEVAYTQRREQEQASAEAFAKGLVETLGPTSTASDIKEVYQKLCNQAKRRKRYDIEGSEYLYEQANSLKRL